MAFDDLLSPLIVWGRGYFMIDAAQCILTFSGTKGGYLFQENRVFKSVHTARSRLAHSKRISRRPDWLNSLRQFAFGSERYCGPGPLFPTHDDPPESEEIDFFSNVLQQRLSERNRTALGCIGIFRRESILLRVRLHPELTPSQTFCQPSCQSGGRRRAISSGLFVKIKYTRCGVRLMMSQAAGRQASAPAWKKSESELVKIRKHFSCANACASHFWGLLHVVLRYSLPHGSRR